MGASASLMTDKLDEDDIQQLCGELYNPFIFNFLKGADGKVDRVQFLQIAMDVVEQEVFHLFSLFSPDGQMDEITFKVFLRNAKILAKKDFSVGSAGELFRSFLVDGSTTVSYIQLRFEVFPKVAEAKEMPLETLLLRFSRSEEPVSQDVIVEGQQLVDSVKNMSEFCPDEELARIKAALALQRASRPRQAKVELQKLKELKKFEAEVADYSEAAVQTHTGPNELKCEEKFKVFVKRDDVRSQNPDMNMRDFLQLCYSANLIPVDAVIVKFTAADARHIFNVTTMKFFNKMTGLFADGVSVGKRISYGVFRNLVIPEIAQVSGSTVEEVVAAIASDNVVAPLLVSSNESIPNKNSPLSQKSAHFENL